jgi:hypothetical protein
MTYTADPVIMPALLDVLAAMRVELGKTAVTPAHFRIVPGLASVFALTAERDECCEGVAWLRVVSFYPSDEFPAQQATFENLEAVSWAVVLELGVGRCGGGPGSEMAPTDAQFLADAQTLMDDAAALRRVGANLEAQPGHVLDYFYGPGAWDPIAAEGNCMGGALHFTVQVAACDRTQAG